MRLGSGDLRRLRRPPWTRTESGRHAAPAPALGATAGALGIRSSHLLTAAPVEGFVGFAIGRSIWWDPLKGQFDGSLQRDAAAQQIADNHLRFIRV
jgi:myo-inositol catabolism protein IolC